MLAKTFQILRCGHVAGVAPKNALSQEYKDHVTKFLGTLRSYGLGDAADYLSDWISGSLDLAPLLDVSALHGPQMKNMFLGCCGRHTRVASVVATASPRKRFAGRMDLVFLIVLSQCVQPSTR